MSDSYACDRHSTRSRLEARLAALPRLALGLAVAAVTFTAAPAARADDFTWHGTVVRIVDGDTIDVRLRNGNRERIRLIGIDSPERGDCGSLRATARARKLARRQQVVLRGDVNVDMRDRFGRLLAYVWLPSGRDLGFRMILAGLAESYPYSPRFRRRGAYELAERQAQRAVRGVWAGCKAAPVAPVAPSGNDGCHPSYVPCVPAGRDLDCPEIGYRVSVVGPDEYRLDGDDDGIGCDDYPVRST